MNTKYVRCRGKEMHRIMVKYGKEGNLEMYVDTVG